MKLQEEFDWYCEEIKEARGDLDKKRREFFDADARVSQLERERGAVWSKMANRIPQETSDHD